MKILHVWDARGIAVVLSKYTDRMFGTKSSIIVRKAFDEPHFVTNETRIGGPAVWFKAYSILKAFSYNIIQAHGAEVMVPLLKSAYPNKPVVLTFYAGMTTSEKWKETKPLWSKADKVFVSHFHYLPKAPKGTELIPIPIDAEIFKDQGQHQKGLALYRDYGAQNKAREIANSLKLSMDIIPFLGMPSSDMPKLLNRYEYLIDIRIPKGYSEPFPDLSQTALEALACGLKVIKPTGEIVEGLPERNRAENVATTYFRTYEKLVN